MSQFRPVRLGLIDEGRLLADLNNLISEAASSLVNYKRTYGDKASKAKSEVTLKVTFAVEDAIGEDAFSIKTALSKKEPSRPASATMAMPAHVDETGELTLFVRASGSSPDDPKQRKLCTDDGRAIDIETGEVAEV